MPITLPKGWQSVGDNEQARRQEKCLDKKKRFAALASFVIEHRNEGGHSTLEGGVTACSMVVEDPPSAPVPVVPSMGTAEPPSIQPGSKLGANRKTPLILCGHKDL